MSRDDIEDLVHRYSDAVVHGDADQWIATWADDGIWDLGNDRRVEGRDAILELWQRAMTRFDAVVQTVMNGVCDLDDNALDDNALDDNALDGNALDDNAAVGTGRWYIHEVMQRGNGERSLMVGHYDDRYVRTDDGWRFAERSLVQHYTGPADLSGSFRAADGAP